MLTKAAHNAYGPWREGQHDDWVLATALTVGHAGTGKPQSDKPERGGAGVGACPEQEGAARNRFAGRACVRLGLETPQNVRRGP
jgi:hypothetical protein